MTEPVFISISQFIEQYSIARTKTHELISQRRLVTGKIGRRTVILNSSAKDFAAAALRQGNMGELASEIFIDDQQAAEHGLCNIHSSVITNQTLRQNALIPGKLAIPSTESSEKNSREKGNA